MNSNKVIGILFCFALFLGGCTTTSKEQNTTSQINSSNSEETIQFDEPRTAENFPLYVEKLKEFAKANGISEQTIEIAFNDTHYVTHIIKADRNQPEKKVTVETYLSRALSETRLALAKEKYLQYHSKLTQATLLTQIPQTYILALWGVESGYGRYQGNEDVISALATLSFEGRRELFFTNELLSALTILDKGYIDKAQFKGSWAGAMGQSQFMPSSYLKYGRDGDNDGIINIWNNLSDVFTSISNYLNTVGWDASLTWGYEVKLPKDFDTELAGLDMEKAKSAKEWLKQGIKINDNKSLDNISIKMWIILPESEKNRAYLVTNNFKTLMHWNRSYHFAISVGKLVDSLVEIR